MTRRARIRRWFHADCRFQIGRRQFALGTFRRTWLIGAQYNPATEGWNWHLGPIGLKTWRAHR